MAETAVETQETKEIEVPEGKTHPLENFGKDLEQEEEMEVADPKSETKAEENKEDSKSEEVKEEVKSEETTSEEEKKEDKKEESKAEDVKDKEENKEADGDKEGEGENKEDESDEIKLEIPKEDKEHKDETWNDIGKELGLEVEGKDFSDFQKGVEKKIESVKDETKSEILSKLKEDPTSLMDELDEQSKLIFKYSLEGGKIADLLSPAKDIDKLLVMSNEDLVQAEYEGQGLSEDEAKEKVESFSGNGELETQAKMLRNGLMQAREETIQNAINEYQTITESQKEDSEAQEQEADKLFREELTSRQDLHGVKLDQEHKDYITKMWNEGKVHELFNDPKAVVDFMLEQTFGEQIRKRESEISYNKGRDEAKKGLHEIPPTTEATTSRSETKPHSEKDGFEKWDGLSEEEDIQVEFSRQ